MSGNCAINTQKPFAEHTDEVIKGIPSFYLPPDVLIDPGDIEASSRVEDTLQIHMIIPFFDEQNVPYCNCSK